LGVGPNISRNHYHYRYADWRALDDSFLDFPKDCPALILCHRNNGFINKEKTLLENWLMN